MASCKCQSKNYRPESLTSIECKVMEGGIRDVFRNALYEGYNVNEILLDLSKDF